VKVALIYTQLLNLLDVVVLSYCSSTSHVNELVNMLLLNGTASKVHLYIIAHYFPFRCLLRHIMPVPNTRCRPSRSYDTLLQVHIHSNPFCCFHSRCYRYLRSMLGLDDNDICRQLRLTLNSSQAFHSAVIKVKDRRSGAQELRPRNFSWSCWTVSGLVVNNHGPIQRTVITPS
jgi:hypothetical protein